MADEPTQNANPTPEGGDRPGGIAGLRQAFMRLPRERRWLIAGVAAAALAGLLFIVMAGGGDEYKTVARGLTAEDLDAATKTLDAKKIPYKLEDQNAIAVPPEQIHEARLALAVGTMPSGHVVGFEIFDEAEMGRSAFSEKVNYHRALEGELARTIRTIEGIDRARVHLVIPAQRVFRELDVEPSASVIVSMHPGFELNPRQAAAIRQLVAGAVERLKPNQVAIVDQYGSMLARPESADMLGNANFEQQSDLERQTEQRVVSLLEPVVGAGKVRARVAITMDYAHVIETKETYNPDGQVVRSEREQTEKSENLDAGAGQGAPGTASNLPARPGARGNNAGGNRASKEATDTIRNYDIDKSVVRRENPLPRVEKMSVAVLVDQAPDGAGGVRPRTEEEIAQYQALVSRAVGIDAARGDQIEVVSVAFAAPESFEEPTTEPETPAPFYENPLILAIAGGGLLLLILLVTVLLWLRRRKKRRQEIAAASKGLDLVIDEPIDLDPSQDVLDRRKRITALRERAVELANEDIRRLGVVFEHWFEQARVEAEEAAEAEEKEQEEAA
ncbi:MAG: flagellar M-ring protein FliF [Myxococcales bacterium]|nr:flagellar M-ring protein FliF [Myxococcales bacterium]MCB9736838.1 flagellar M-ring protein FliF [Deltaproteobacteria bacterium]